MNKEESGIQLIVFRLGKEEYGVQITHVREIINLYEVTALPQTDSSLEGVVDLRGQIIPIINLKKRLDLKDTKYVDRSRVIVVEVEGRLLGMKVDDAVEVLTLDGDAVQAIAEVLSKVEEGSCAVGVGKVGNRLIVLLDLSKVLGTDEMPEISKVLEEATV